MPANLENSGVATGLEKVSFYSNSKERQCPQMLKILLARLQQYMNRELPDVQHGLEKAEEPEIKLPTSIGSEKSKRIPEKHLLLH